MLLTILLIIHVICVIVWIGGVAFVTTVIFPMIYRTEGSLEKALLFQGVEHRFAGIVKWLIGIVGITGFWLLFAKYGFAILAQPKGRVLLDKRVNLAGLAAAACYASFILYSSTMPVAGGTNPLEASFRSARPVFRIADPNRSVRRETKFGKSLLQPRSLIYAGREHHDSALVEYQVLLEPEFTYCLEHRILMRRNRRDDGPVVEPERVGEPRVRLGQQPRQGPPAQLLGAAVHFSVFNGPAVVGALYLLNGLFIFTFAAYTWVRSSRRMAAVDSQAS